jgi:hypothetical protein
MNFNSFFNVKVKKMDWLDIGLIKWSCVLFGITIAILFPAITEISAWWFIGLLIALAIRPIYRFYLK